MGREGDAEADIDFNDLFLYFVTVRLVIFKKCEKVQFYINI